MSGCSVPVAGPSGISKCSSRRVANMPSGVVWRGVMLTLTQNNTAMAVPFVWFSCAACCADYQTMDMMVTLVIPE